MRMWMYKKLILRLWGSGMSVRLNKALIGLVIIVGFFIANIASFALCGFTFVN